MAVATDGRQERYAPVPGDEAGPRDQVPGATIQQNKARGPAAAGGAKRDGPLETRDDAVAIVMGDGGVVSECSAQEPLLAGPAVAAEAKR
jgi:hypothetical protein